MQLNAPQLTPTAGLPVEKAAPADPLDAELRETAKAFEAVFVKQMLQYAGLAEAFGADSSSPVASFADFVLDELAADMVEQGGFGLADDLYAHLQQAQQSAEESENLGITA